MNKKLVITALSVATIGAGLFGASQVAAQGTTTPQQTLVQQIAQKFGLNVADVQSVFDQNRSTHQANREKRSEDWLSQLVTAGKLTEDQKQKIIAKRTELANNFKSQIQSFKTMTPTERKAAIQKSQADLKAWATANGIDVKYLFGMGMRMRHPFLGRMMWNK